MKCQSLFSGKNKKYIINLLSLPTGLRVVKVKIQCIGICIVTVFMTDGSTMSMCLGHDTAMRQHNKRVSVPTVTSRHNHNMAKRLLTMILYPISYNIQE